MLSPTLIRSIALPAAFLPAFLLGPTASRSTRPHVPVPYNSEEHQLIVDRAVALVNIPPGTFPDAVRITAITPAAYSKRFSDLKQNPTVVKQDLCYPTPTYYQSKYNKEIDVPAVSRTPASMLTVRSYTSVSPEQSGYFTLGELAALYGDYRKTTYCDASGRCFLTNSDISSMRFYESVWEKLQRPLAAGWDSQTMNTAACPEAINATSYLADVASGVVPPMRALGNTLMNLAGPDEYDIAGWWGDEMLRIGNINDWHFTDAAVAWYVGMHRLAMKYAGDAVTDPRQWVKALHYEANALHSLTDLFAFGHVVVHRDETSAYINAEAVVTTGSTPRSRTWMENVLKVGGGTRTSGHVNLGAALPTIADVATDRNDFFPTYRSAVDIPTVVAEMNAHDSYNKGGARVKNLNGDTFDIAGDGRLAETGDAALKVMTDAVRVSVQSLIDAYTQIKSQGGTVAAIGQAGSPLFAALKYVPVYVVNDSPNNYFVGRWTTYAAGVNAISGAGVTMNKARECVIPAITGKSPTPSPSGLCVAY